MSDEKFHHEQPIKWIMARTGKRSDLQRAKDAIQDKIITLQAVFAELVAVEQQKPTRKPRKAKVEKVQP
jgi:DNA-binding protein H-NS